MRRSRSRAILAGVLLMIAIGILLLSVSGYLQPAEDLLLRPMAEVQSWIAIRYNAVRDVLTSPSDISTLRQENAILEAEVARLQQEIISLQEQATEAEILSALLNYARSQPDNRYMAANVIGQDVSPFLRSIWIGTGSEAGVAQGMPVVTERGLVGRVAEVFATISRVQLITDPEAAVNVEFQTSRADGSLSAQLSGELWVDLISQDADIGVSELVLTSGLGGNFPADIPVGSVLSVRKRDVDIFQQAVIEPSVNFADLDIVLVITNFQPLPINQVQ
ncbi:MAG: rod shape-determining protein MreC [Anaerolineales bacterium]|nr:rod shape-determining protein MreC [Anaerolineales bacterium]